MGVITFYEKFSHRIGSLLEDDFADALLLVEGVKIPVHRSILAAHSEYFKHLFSSKKDSQKTSYQRDAASGSQDFAEIGDTLRSNDQTIVEISDVNFTLANNLIELKNTKVEVVRAVLDYFYRGEYDYHENVESHFLALELAHQFKLKDLEATLIENMGMSICQENFVKFYNMKMRYKNWKLENSCVSFLKENGREIAMSDSFSKLTKVSLLSLLDEKSFAAAEIDIFRAAERWASDNKPNNQTKKDIVEKIRLATMSMEDLFDVVSTSKELPSIDIIEPIRNITKKDAASANFRHEQCISDPIPDLNVAQSSLGAEVLCGSVTGEDWISDSSGCTSHKLEGKPNCILVKLDQTYRLNAFILSLDSNEGRSYKYYVEVSVDGKKWLRVVDHSNYWCRSHQFLRFNPRAVKFIRMTGTNKDLQIKSLEAVYTKEKFSLLQGIPVGSTNIALESKGATVTGGYYEPMYCINGKENSCAAMRDVSPLIIKLGQPYWLSSLQVRIYTGGNSYTIDCSPNGESWQPVGGETEGEDDKVWRTFEFSRRIVLQFRVTMKRIQPDYDSIVLYHFESPASTMAVTD